MTREEKLEEAKRLYKTANADQRYVLESLFSELAGSKDERIRKAILEFVTIVADSKSNKMEWIAWLEKQSPKPKWTEEDDGMMKSIMVDIEYARRCHECDAHYNVELDWLESLKQRMGGEE